MPDTFHNILVVKLKSIGDIVIITPVFASLRHYYPEARITAVVNKGTEGILADNPHVDNVLPLRRFPGFFRDGWEQLRFLRDIRRQRFDLVLELTGNDRGAFTGYVSGAPRRFGFASKKIKKFDRHVLYTDLVHSNGATHIVHDQLRMIEHLGHAPVTTEPAVFWSEEEYESCRGILQEKGVAAHDRYAVIHPTLFARYREWKSEECAALCEYLHDTWNIRPVLVCGTVESERKFIERVEQLSNGRAVNLAGRLPLRQLIALIGNAVLFVGVDSGPMHIAAAAKTPVVALFGPQNQRRWGPFGEGHSVVQKSWECVPCRKKGCDDDGLWSRCLQELSLGEVVAAVELQMNRRAEAGLFTKPS